MKKCDQNVIQDVPDPSKPVLAIHAELTTRNRFLRSIRYFPFLGLMPMNKILPVISGTKLKLIFKSDSEHGIKSRKTHLFIYYPRGDPQLHQRRQWPITLPNLQDKQECYIKHDSFWTPEVPGTHQLAIKIAPEHEIQFADLHGGLFGQRLKVMEGDWTMPFHVYGLLELGLFYIAAFALVISVIALFIGIFPTGSQTTTLHEVLSLSRFSP